MPSCIGYTGKPSVVVDFATYVKDIYKTITFQSAAMGSTIGVHVGPGACVVAFFAKN
jgi:fatty acid-binding protein DegV